MNRETDFRKNLLTKASASIVSIAAIISNGSIALGSGLLAPNGVMFIKDGTLTDKESFRKIDQAGGEWQEGNNQNIEDLITQDKAITYNSTGSLIANVDGGNIIAINLNEKSPRKLIVKENTIIGSIFGNTSTHLPIVIEKDKTLKLVGTPATHKKHGFSIGENVYSGLGKIILNEGALIINPTPTTATINEKDTQVILNGPILARDKVSENGSESGSRSGNESGSGILSILVGVQIKENIGDSTNFLKTIDFNTTDIADLEGDVYANSINIQDNGTLNVKGLLVSDVTFTTPGVLTADKGIDGKVEGAGTLNLGIGRITQNIGAVMPMKAINFQGKGNLELNLAHAETFTIAHPESNVMVDSLKGTLIYAAPGTLTTAKGIRGDINFNNIAGTLKVANDQDIVGNISSDGGTNGIIEFLGSGKLYSKINNLGKLKIGKGEVKIKKDTLSEGDEFSGEFSIDEIQGNGTSKVIFDKSFKLKGGINYTGGEAICLIFQGGANSISGVVGTQDNPVGDIRIQDGNISFGDKVKAANIIISEGASSIFSSNVTAQEIRGANHNQGIVKFNNDKNIVASSKIGTTYALNTIEIANQDVEITEKISVKNILFSSDKEATLTLSKAATITEGISTTGDNLHTLKIADDFAIQGLKIGSEDHRLKTIELQNNNTLTINDKFYSGISTAVNNNGKVIFNTDNSFAYELGLENLKLQEVTFAGNAEVKGDVYASKIQINNGKTANFTGGNLKNKLIPPTIVDGTSLPRTLKTFDYSTLIDSSEGIHMNERDSKVIFSNSTLVNAPIHHGGYVNCANNTWFQKDINDVVHITFAPTKFTLLEGNISAKDIVANDAHIIILGNPVTVSGSLAAQNLTLDLGDSQLQYTGNANLTGKLEINSFYNTATFTVGGIDIQPGSALDLSGINKLLVKLKARSDINQIPKGATCPLITTTEGGTIIPPTQVMDTTLEINEENNFVRWTIDPNSLTLHAQDISNIVLRRIVRSAPPRHQQLAVQLAEIDGKGSNDGDIVTYSNDNVPAHSVNYNENYNVNYNDESNIIHHETNLSTSSKEIGNNMAKHNDGNSDSTSINYNSEYDIIRSRNEDSHKFKNNLGFMAPDAAYESMDRLLEPAAPIGQDILSNILTEIAEDGILQVDNHTTLRGLTRKQATAAGDEDISQYGIWVNPLYGYATQKINKEIKAYNLKSVGAVFGVDTFIKNNFLIGIAYSRFHTRITYKDQKAGDKTKGTTNIFSLYSSYNCPNSWVIDGMFSYGQTRVKDFIGRLTAKGAGKTILETATGKYKSTYYGGKLLLGYNCQTGKKLVITPLIGLRYSNFDDPSYTEAGTSFQNLTYSTRSYNKLEGIVGGRVLASIELNKVLLMPEFHGYLNYNLKRKPLTIEARLGGMEKPLPNKTITPHKRHYSLGTSLTAKYKMLEYGIAYNADLAKKYIAHQGSLKLRVNL